MPTQIAQNYRQVLDRIHRVAQAAGRDPAQVKLITVTKGHPLEAVEAAIRAGATRLGENYVEEGLQKLLACSAQDEVEWHMIGHVQSRKAAPVAERFSYLHSLDSLKLALRLDRFAGQAGRRLPVLLECNVSGEESKYGWPAWQEDAWPGLLPDIEQVLALAGLEVRGLMTMAPFLPDPEQARPYFKRLRGLQAYLAERLPHCDWAELSMGMSADYEVAIQEGATLVRIGTAIMGPRPPRAREKS